MGLFQRNKGNLGKHEHCLSHLYWWGPCWPQQHLTSVGRKYLWLFRCELDCKVFPHNCVLTIIFTPLLGLAYLGFLEESERRAEGCGVFITSGLGGENRKPDYVFAIGNCVLLTLSLSSIFLNILSSKKALVDLSTRVTVAGRFPVLMKITDRGKSD